MFKTQRHGDTEDLFVTCDNYSSCHCTLLFHFFIIVFVKHRVTDTQSIYVIRIIFSPCLSASVFYHLSDCFSFLNSGSLVNRVILLSEIILSPCLRASVLSIILITSPLY